MAARRICHACRHPPGLHAGAPRAPGRGVPECPRAVSVRCVPRHGRPDDRRIVPNRMSYPMQFNFRFERSRSVARRIFSRGIQSMLRRIAVVGDALSSGGQITPYGGPPITFGGYQIAQIGGQAFCAACKRPGIIAKSGGPYRMNFMGEGALDGDIVLCGCPIHPHIVASLSGESWCDDMVEGHGKVVSNLTAAGGVASVKKGAFDEQVEATASGAV